MPIFGLVLGFVAVPGVDYTTGFVILLSPTRWGARMDTDVLPKRFGSVAVICSGCAVDCQSFSRDSC